MWTHRARLFSRDAKRVMHGGGVRRIGANSANARANDAMMRIRVVQTRCSRIPILPYSSRSPPHWRRILRVPPCARVAMATRTPPYSLETTCAAERTRGRFDRAFTPSRIFFSRACGATSRIVIERARSMTGFQVSASLCARFMNDTAALSSLLEKDS